MSDGKIPSRQPAGRRRYGRFSATCEAVCQPFNRAYGTGSDAIAHPPLKWRAIFGVEALTEH